MSEENRTISRFLASGLFFPLAIMLLRLTFLILLFLLGSWRILAHPLRIHVLLMWLSLSFHWLSFCVAHHKLLST